MPVNTGRLFTIVAILLCTSANSPRNLHTDQQCRSSRDYASTTQLLLVDRTTRANSSADRRWRDALPGIIRPRTTTGMIVVAEPRDNATQSAILGRGCLEPFPVAAPSAQVGYGGRLWSWAANGVGRFLGNDPAKRSEADEIAAAERVSDIVAHRSADLRFLEPLVTTGTPTKHDTEIAELIVNSLASECAGRRLCRVYLFSDLLDSRAKRLALGGRTRPDAAGRDRAHQLLEEVRPDLGNTTVEFRCWGFGRSDVNPDEQLPDTERRRLRAYWNGFLSEITSKARGGSALIGDQYPG